MKITHLMMSASRSAGGMFYAAQPLTRSLSDLGCDCKVVAPRDRYTFEDAEQWGAVEVCPYSIIGPQSLGFSKGIERLIGVPDIQHAHGIWMYFSQINRKTAQKNSVPYVISPHGMLDSWAIGNSVWKKRMVSCLYERRHLTSANCIHALCESEANAIRNYGLKNPICIIPNGIDLPSLTSEIQKGNRASVGLKKRLLFLGRIHPKKGLVDLIKAFAGVGKEILADWELVIAGWDQNHQSEIVALASDLGIDGKVSFPGPQFGAEKENLLRNCDAFVLTSKSEGLPMSVLEAWSYGLPALITTTSNLPQGKKYGAAIECEPNSVSVYEGLQRLFELSDFERSDMGRKGRSLVEQHFSWSIVSNQMLEVYGWLSGKGSVPSTVLLN